MPPLRLPAIGQKGFLCKDRLIRRGSSESPCRAVRLVNFPRDGHVPAPLDLMHSHLKAVVLLAAG